MSNLIVALDYENEHEAFNFINKVEPSLCKLKVGKAMFTRLGPEFVKKIIDKGFDVFLDLKFHDIPQQVAGACRAAADLGVWMLNVHASGGFAMMQAAKKAIEGSNPKPILIAVTVLTSLSAQDLFDIGLEISVEEQVLKLTHLADKAGLEGVVCSAQEARLLRKNFGKQFCLVTPGIRLSDSSEDDQKRIVTPKQALANGSNYLVIGRPITQANNPKKTLTEILNSLSA